MRLLLLNFLCTIKHMYISSFKHKKNCLKFHHILLHCPFMISSGWFLFHEDVKIKDYLEEKFLSLSFVDKQFKFFLENKISGATVNATNSC